jgi:hypothetical protein
MSTTQFRTVIIDDDRGCAVFKVRFVYNKAGSLNYNATPYIVSELSPNCHKVVGKFDSVQAAFIKSINDSIELSSIDETMRSGDFVSIDFEDFAAMVMAPE